MNLDDVQIIHRPEHEGATGFITPATFDDVVALAESLGGVHRQWYASIVVMPKDRPDLGSELPPGEYLILPLRETP